MLDLQQMYQQPVRRTQDMPMAMSTSTPDPTGFDRGFAWRSPFNNRQMRLGDVLQSRIGGNHHQGGGPRPGHTPQDQQVPGTTPTPQMPQPMGTFYNNPFGASITGGTLGAMLARQPTY